jgi:6-phosphogluconolactonase (cycloisomerase 2 family)
MTNVYTQTNETENRIINFKQGADGTLTEVQRVSTGGKGTNGFTPLTGEKSSPDSLISSNSIIVSKDRKNLFAVNAGDNSVSWFTIGADGMLTLTDTQSTGNEVSGPSGTANSLAYNDADGTLYVSHSFGPNHIRAFTVRNGRLALRPDSGSVNLGALTDRVPTQIVLTPDSKFLLASVLFDARPSQAGLTLAKEKTLVVFPVVKGGGLGDPVFNEAGGITPFANAFLNHRPNTFVTVLAAESSAVVSTIDSEGRVKSGKSAKIDTTIDGMAAEPSEICWISVSDDDAYAFGTNFGYGTVSSFAINGEDLSVNMSTAAEVVGDGTFKGLAGVSSSGAGDNAVAGRFLYQLYANAKKLVGYMIESNGALTKVTEVAVPYNSTQGLATT